MMLPEITQEILTIFGDGYGNNTQLIEWAFGHGQEVQWTQTAVDFACLIAPKVVELEAEIERMRLALIEGVKLHDKYNDIVGRDFCTCDICSYQEAKKP